MEGRAVALEWTRGSPPGSGRVGRVDIDFLSAPKPTGTFREPSPALVAEKQHFGASRRDRWFDHP